MPELIVFKRAYVGKCNRVYRFTIQVFKGHKKTRENS